MSNGIEKKKQKKEIVERFIVNKTQRERADPTEQQQRKQHR